MTGKSPRNYTQMLIEINPIKAFHQGAQDGRKFPRLLLHKGNKDGSSPRLSPSVHRGRLSASEEFLAN